jgi:hypothetical protein
MTKIMTKHDLPDLLHDTINYLGGSASIIEICKVFWSKHEMVLRNSGDLFYTWQYDIRWAATELRKTARMKSADLSPTGIWEII